MRIIEQIKILADENLQSDERFVESFINGRKAGGKGPRVIRQQLVAKGVEAFLIERYLDERHSIWFELAEITYLKISYRIHNVLLCRTLIGNRCDCRCQRAWRVHALQKASFA